MLPLARHSTAVFQTTVLLVGALSAPPAATQEAELAVDPELAHHEVASALEAARSYLPVGFALEGLEGTAVGVHRRPDRHPAQVGRSEGLPVLLLAERSYFATGGMLDLADAAIDSLAYLFEALFELWAERAWLADPARHDELDAIARDLYSDLPPEHRLEALIDAQAQYAGHLLSIAATVERSKRRGSGPCGRLDTPLFRLWERTGAGIAYHGAVWIDENWKTSGVDLPVALRTEVRRGPLAGWWTGRAADDFGGRACEKSVR